MLLFWIARRACTAVGAMALLVAVSLPLSTDLHSDAVADTPLSIVQKGQVWDQAIHILGGNANVSSRWAGPVHFALVTDGIGVSSKATAVEIITEAVSITRLPLTIVATPALSIEEYLSALRQGKSFEILPCGMQSSCANFVVVIANLATMRDIARAVPLRDVYQKSLEAGQNTVCFFAPFQKASVIHRAMVYVRSDLSAAMTRTCLQEEIYQSFGLFNDYTDSDYFSFDNRVTEKKITRFDKALLSTVYEFSPGAPVFAIVQKLMERL